MDWLAILVLAAAASMDCVIIGFNYGVKGVRIGNASNAFMAVVCFCGTLLSMLLGRLVSHTMDPAWGGAMGGLVFVLLGLWMLFSSLFPRKNAAKPRYNEDPERIDKDASKVIELRESLLIGLLLCVNNIGIGIGGGIAGVSILATPAACAALGFVFIKAGCAIGTRVENNRLAKPLELLSALMILILGAMEILSLL